MRPKTYCILCGCLAHAHGYCDTHYRRLKKAGVAMASLSVVERFWSKVQKTDGCWIWAANKNRRGYGKFCLNKRQEPAHRVAYTLTYGEIPNNLWVLHRCDNPSCVRPDHLYLGTHTDNMRDRQERGRAASGDKNGSKTHPERVLRGEQCIHTKASDEQIEAIRCEYAVGGTSTLKLANKYGLGKSQIHNIVSGKQR